MALPDLVGKIDRGVRIIGGVDKDSGEPIQIAVVEVATDVFALATAPYDYNPESSAYEAKQRPYIHIDDLEVSTGDLEKLQIGNYFKRTKPYLYGGGRLKYNCKNTDIAANETDTDWLVWKYSDAAIPVIEGPRVGAVNTVEVVDAFSWVT
jgi:hypothetical protein